MEHVKEDYYQMKENVKQEPVLEHVDTVPIVSSTPFPDDVSAADPALDLPTHTSTTGEKMSEKMGEIKDKTGEKMGEMRENAEEMKDKTIEKMEEAKEKTGGRMEHMKEDYHHLKENLKSDYQHIKEKFHEAGDHLRHSISPTRTTTTTTTQITTTEPETFATKTEESRELNPNEKEEMEQFPKKMNQEGDVESFKKDVPSGHERG